MTTEIELDKLRNVQNEFCIDIESVTAEIHSSGIVFVGSSAWYRILNIISGELYKFRQEIFEAIWRRNVSIVGSSFPIHNREEGIRWLQMMAMTLWVKNNKPKFFEWRMRTLLRDIPKADSIGYTSDFLERMKYAYQSYCSSKESSNVLGDLLVENIYNTQGEEPKGVREVTNNQLTNTNKQEDGTNVPRKTPTIGAGQTITGCGISGQRSRATITVGHISLTKVSQG